MWRKLGVASSCTCVGLMCVCWNSCIMSSVTRPAVLPVLPEYRHHLPSTLSTATATALAATASDADDAAFLAVLMLVQQPCLRSTRIVPIGNAHDITPETDTRVITQLLTQCPYLYTQQAQSQSRPGCFKMTPQHGGRRTAIRTWTATKRTRSNTGLQLLAVVRSPITSMCLHWLWVMAVVVCLWLLLLACLSCYSVVVYSTRLQPWQPWPHMRS